MIVSSLVKARIAKVISIGDPLDLRDDALCMGNLGSPPLLLVCELAERTISIFGEVFGEGGPFVLCGLLYDIDIRDDHGPELFHLLLL